MPTNKELKEFFSDNLMDPEMDEMQCRGVSAPLLNAIVEMNHRLNNAEKAIRFLKENNNARR